MKSGATKNAPGRDYEMKDKLFFFLLGIIVVCVAGFGFVANAASQETVNPSDGSINMIQVCNWIWCMNINQQNAEHVNKPNSEANKNNAEANLANAQATKTVADTYKANNPTEFLGGFALGGLALICLTIPALLIGGGFLLSIFSRIKP